MVFVIFTLMAIGIFRERPKKNQPQVDDGLFLPIDVKGLPPLYPSDGGGINLNSHYF